MAITVFNPQTIEVGPIGPMMAAKVANEGLKEFFESKSGEDGDGNLSSIVIGDSDNIGVGVGTWDAGQGTKEPIPVMFDEVLFIIEGTLIVSTDDERREAHQGEVVHIAAGSFVSFNSTEGCRLVWCTSPPTWKALEAAWEAGLMRPPGK